MPPCIRELEGVAPHLIVCRASSEVLERLGLREAAPGESVDVFVRETAFPESTFRAAVCRDGAWATDVIQTWLYTAHRQTSKRSRRCCYRLR